MRRFGGSILLSATDLMRFMGCPHATYLDLQHLNGVVGLNPCEDSEDAALLQARGDEGVELAVEHRIGVTRFDPSAHILDQLVGVQHVVAYLGSPLDLGF